MFKHIWVKVSNTWEFQSNWSNNTLKTGFFRISGKSGSRIWNFFGLKPSRDQDRANKKKFSHIGPALPEEIGHKHTNKQTNIVLLYKRDNKKKDLLSILKKILDWEKNGCFCNFLYLRRFHMVEFIPFLRGL